MRACGSGFGSGSAGGGSGMGVGAEALGVAGGTALNAVAAPSGDAGGGDAGSDAADGGAVGDGNDVGAGATTQPSEAATKTSPSNDCPAAVDSSERIDKPRIAIITLGLDVALQRLDARDVFIADPLAERLFLFLTHPFRGVEAAQIGEHRPPFL